MDEERMNKDYPGLTTVSILFKVIGILVFAIAAIVLIWGIVILTDKYRGNEGLYYIGVSLLSMLFAVPYFATAELIKLIIRIEFNTRKGHFDESVNENNSQPIRPSSFSQMKNDVSYEEWKRENPSKTINDYYAAMRK